MCVCLKRESHSEREKEERRERDLQTNSNALNERDIFKHRTQLWERERGERERERERLRTKWQVLHACSCQMHTIQIWYGMKNIDRVSSASKSLSYCKFWDVNRIFL